MAKRVRTFVAVALAPAVRNRLASLQDRLARVGPAVKWVEPDNLHLTLAFLGEVDDRGVLDVCLAVRRVAAAVPPFEASVTGVGCFPNARRPRVLYAGVEEGAEELRALHAALEGPLAELGCYRREDREYTPHVTLGRVQGGEDGGPFGAEVPKLAGWQGGATPVREVLVMGSELRPDGPEYTVLGRGRLAGKPGDDA